jgi:hypothetical protein
MEAQCQNLENRIAKNLIKHAGTFNFDLVFISPHKVLYTHRKKQIIVQDV